MTFEEVVAIIVRDVATCPAFATPSVLVPIPRSGSSRASFEHGACAWPCNALAVALAAAHGHVVAQLLERPAPIHRSSDGAAGRASVKDHVASLRVRFDEALCATRIVLIDDTLTKGSQSMAALIALRRAGYTGPIVVYCVHQTVAPFPTPEQRQPGLSHLITWQEGQQHGRRVEVGRWRQ